MITMTSDMSQDILKLMQKLDARLSALETGKPVKEQKPIKVSQAELICQRVLRDLETKQLVRLSRYAVGAQVRWAREELCKDKALRIITEGNETYVMKATPTKTITLIAKSGEKEPKTAKIKKQGKGKRNIAKIIELLDKGKTLTSKRIARLLHRSVPSAVGYMNRIGAMSGYMVEKGKNNKLFLRKSNSEPKQAKHQPPMHQKSGYNKFMAEKLSFYQKQGGLNGHDAFMSAVADWNRTKAGSTPVPQVHPSPFPAFQSVRSELRPILIGVLDRLFRSGIAVDFKGISYALDITKESEYVELAGEIVAKQEELKSYFGVGSGKLSWDGKVLRFVR